MLLVYPNPLFEERAVRFLAVLIYPDTCFLFSGSFIVFHPPAILQKSSITCSLVCKAHRLLATEPNVSSSFKEAFQSFGICMCNPPQKAGHLIKRRSEASQEQTLSAPLCSPHLHSQWLSVRVFVSEQSRMVGPVVSPYRSVTAA